MMKSGLVKELFKQSAIDPCLFLCNDAIIISYVDDCLIFMKDKKRIESLLENLRKTVILTDKGEDVKAYLGLKVEKSNDGTITMTQSALIDRILSTLS